MDTALSSQITSHPNQLTEYLSENNIPLKQGNLIQTIISLLMQKDKMISVLDGQITKYKAQQMKNNKLISQLQDKIVQMSPNNNNTGSNFMMASEFKDYFDDFMKNCVPASLSPLLPYPKVYAKYTNQLFNNIYSSINSRVENKISQICKIMQLEQTVSNMSVLRSSLLKIMQDNNEKFLADTMPTTADYTQYENEQIQQIISNEQFGEFVEKLRKICGYMILQEKKWSFVMPEGKVEKFVKKDFVCIDGWIKEKDDVILILEGLIREGEESSVVKHPNLKNYVIPYSGDDEEDFELISKKQATKPLQICPNLKIEKVDQECQYSPKPQKPPKKICESKIKKPEQHSKQNKQNNPPPNLSAVYQKELKSDVSCSSLTNNRSKIINQSQLIKNNDQQYRSKIETAIRKLNRVQQKYYDNLPEVDSVSLLMPFTDHNALKQKQKNIQINHQSNNPSITIIKSAKLKNSTKVHNLISDPSFEDILPLPQRKKDIIDQLPLKRQSSRTKKSNSRKTSAGKIVAQAIESKQNIFHRNNKEHSLKEKDKECTKQAIYKDIIKQKLGSDYKTERERPKQSKNKQKQQDRPLRFQHIKKIKQKYLNI